MNEYFREMRRESTAGGIGLRVFNGADKSKLIFDPLSGKEAQ